MVAVARAVVERAEAARAAEVRAEAAREVAAVVASRAEGERDREAGDLGAVGPEAAAMVMVVAVEVKVAVTGVGLVAKGRWAVARAGVEEAAEEKEAVVAMVAMVAMVVARAAVVQGV